jgi:hypothetical protein
VEEMRIMRDTRPSLSTVKREERKPSRETMRTIKGRMKQRKRRNTGNC